MLFLRVDRDSAIVWLSDMVPILQMDMSCHESRRAVEWPALIFGDVEEMFEVPK
jgi:hypothetical protein